MSGRGEKRMVRLLTAVGWEKDGKNGMGGRKDQESSYKGGWEKRKRVVRWWEVG